MEWLGIDIGGANIKLADGRGFADSRPFALWRAPDRLAGALRIAMSESPASDRLAITMTGELADCFATKTEGVRFLLQAAVEASDGRDVVVYLRKGVLVTPHVAQYRPLDAAAANWHALARFAARYAADGAALLIDIGSTTCDIVPLVRGGVMARGDTDTERLIEGELVYTGVERSPLCGLVEAVPHRGRLCPVTQEWFATTSDAYLVTGDLAENASSEHSADGRPNLRRCAIARIARMVGADTDAFDSQDAIDVARAVIDAQVRRLAEAAGRVMRRMTEPCECCILSGQGEFLARRVLESLAWNGRIVSLNGELGSGVSRCAPAHALAVLARESMGA